ncbi:enoyl-CoA hydratase/isomerase family protein, partial [Escherichia coli]
MNNGTIDLQRNGFIATLVINRPAKLNALTPEMLEQLLAHCHTLETDSEIRVVLLTSASEKAFCVGADIHRWTSLSALDMWRNWIRRGHQAFDALAQLPQPVIALLHGLAYGGGLELAATADIRICSAEAQMALPETGLATVPGWSGTQRLTALLGRSLVKELVFTGEPLDAQRALSCGLVNRVVAREALHDAGLQLAQRIAQRAPVAVQIAKQVIDAG